MTFHVGQKVVCVDSSDPGGGTRGANPSDLLRVGATYTVRDTALQCPYWRSGRPVIWLQEIRRDKAVFEGKPAPDMPFYAGRFRPVVERKTETGMAILREILDRETVKDPVRTAVKARQGD